MPLPKPTPAGAPPKPSSTTSSRASRTACAWSICGATRARRSQPPISQPAKTRLWKPKSASWPTPKSSTPPPWAPSTSSTKAAASAEAALRAALRNVEELARYDARFTEPAQQLASARATVGDLAASLRDYAEGINASPERLAEIEDRLALLDRLKRKYGKTIAEVIAFGEDVARKLAEVEDRDEILKTLRAELASAAAAYRASRRSPHRRAQGRRRQTRQAGRSPDQLPGHEGPLRGRRHLQRTGIRTGPPPAGTRSNTASPPTPASPSSP